LALSLTGKISRTIAIDATPAAQLPIAWINRKTINVSIDVAKKQPIEVKM